MSTHSFIAKLNSDGTVKGVYCHYDGYPDGVGKVLAENYTDESKVDKIIAKGAIRSLAKTVARTERLDDDEESAVYNNLNEMVEHVWDDMAAEFAYVFSDGKWTTYSPAE